MRPDELERLLWRDAEGELSAADRERLAEALAAEPEGERRRRDLAAYAELLATVEPVPAPPSLAQGIERAVAALPLPRRRTAWRAALAGMLAPQRRTRLAWATAGVLIGVVTALVLLSTEQGGAPGAGDGRYYGALVIQPSTLAGAETAALPDRLGTITLAPAEGSLLCRLRLDRAVAGGVTLEVVGAGVTVAELEADGVAARRIASAPDAATVAIEGVGSVSLAAHTTGSRRNVTFRVVVAGATVFEREAAIAAGAVR